MEFNLSEINSTPEPLYSFELDFYTIRDLGEPIEWAKSNFILSTSYAHPGKFEPYPYQIEPINAIKSHEKVILCWATQTGKSLTAEIMVSWCIDQMPMNAMICYAKRDTVEDMFEDRIRPLVQQVPAIRKYFTGSEKDLRRKKIKLSHMFLRVASSEVPSDIATWAAGLIYASEVAKYRGKKGFDPIESLKRRQEAYRIVGRHRAIFESSPLRIGDPLHQEMTAAGTVVYTPHYECPHCKKLICLTYRQIKEKPNSKGEYDHDPERIRNDAACWYECQECKAEITEAEHMAMCRTVPVYRLPGDERKPAAVAYQVSRLVDPAYSFVECLARWFSAAKKGGAAMSTFVNEDMAEFWAERTVQISADYLLTRKKDYYQFRVGDIPNEVLILVSGADCQDDGFYFVVNGYGKGMNQFQVRSGFIKSPKGLSEGGADPRQIAADRFRAGVNAMPYIRRDGSKLSILFGFIDRGGHRPEDVDFICDHNPEWAAYVGLTQVDPKRPLVAQSSNGNYYLGQSQMYSVHMSQIIASSRYWLPADVLSDYLEQVRNQWLEDKIDALGNRKQVWVKSPPDHFRSCENMALAACDRCDVKNMLFTPETVRELEKYVETAQIDEPHQDVVDTSDYFSGRRGRRSF